MTDGVGNERRWRSEILELFFRQERVFGVIRNQISFFADEEHATFVFCKQFVADEFWAFATVIPGQFHSGLWSDKMLHNSFRHSFWKFILHNHPRRRRIRIHWRSAV